MLKIPETFDTRPWERKRGRRSLIEPGWFAPGTSARSSFILLRFRVCARFLQQSHLQSTRSGPLLDLFQGTLRHILSRDQPGDQPATLAHYVIGLPVSGQIYL